MIAQGLVSCLSLQICAQLTLQLDQEGRKGYIADPDTQFIIHVPGIRENSPRLDIGDTVHLREIRMDIQAGTDLAFEGRVTTQRKREGLSQFSRRQLANLSQRNRP